MAVAQAGWYEQPGAPGVTRYWDGAAWLPVGVGPAAPVAGFSPQSTVFTPAAPREPAVIQPEPALTHIPAAITATPAHPAPTPAGAEAEQTVPWDVVGIARTPEASAPESAPLPQWHATPEQASAPNPAAGTTYPQQWTPASYAPPLAERRKLSGVSKIGLAVVTVAIGLGVRWAIGLFFGGDYSDDGAIEVDTPAYWTTYSATGPDITYAMDASWPDVSYTEFGLTKAPGARVIDARTLSTGFDGNRALMLLASSSLSLPGAEASRDDLSDPIDEVFDLMESNGVTIVSREKPTILRSDAGERWAFASAQLTVEGFDMEYFIAAAFIAGHAIEVDLIVPEGVELTKHDLLAVANSVRETS